jgi:DNA repair protein RadC
MAKQSALPGLAEASLLDSFDPDIKPTSPKLSVSGHRGRLRARLLTAGGIALADHELRRDTKPIARSLIGHFGSFAGAISASATELAEIEGLGEAGIAALKVVQAASQRLIKAEVLYRPLLGNWERLMEYLQSVLAREKVEQFRILFLDNRNRLLADEPQARGTVNHTPVYPREVIKRALELHATAIILVHNHPSGDPSPSQEDIDMTKEIKKGASALSIVLHDHVIIGNGQWLSFRKTGLL